MKAGIAGAGILGRLLAFSLVNAGWQVSLFDKDDESGQASCSMTAAGLLTPLAELDKSDLLIFKLGEEALQQHWPRLLKQLASPIFFNQRPSLILAHPQDRAELIHFISLIEQKLNHNHFYQKLTHADIENLEPELTKFTEAYKFLNEASIDNQNLFTALGDYLRASSVHWHSQIHVQQVEPYRLTTSEHNYQFDMVFDCRGLGAKSIFPDLRSVRGELLWLYAPDVRIKHPIRLLHPRYSLYIVPRPQQVYIIGSSEIESENYDEISVRTTLELLTAAYYVHPGFAEAKILQTRAHCRPTLPQHLPKIKYTSGLIAANGLYRHGYLISPSLVADIMTYLTKDESEIRYPQLWEQF